MGAQGTNAFNYGQQASKDDLKILILYCAGIKPEIFAYNSPNRLEVLL